MDTHNVNQFTITAFGATTLAAANRETLE